MIIKALSTRHFRVQALHAYLSVIFVRSFYDLYNEVSQDIEIHLKFSTYL